MIFRGLVVNKVGFHFLFFFELDDWVGDDFNLWLFLFLLFGILFDFEVFENWFLHFGEGWHIENGFSLVEFFLNFSKVNYLNLIHTLFKVLYMGLEFLQSLDEDNRDQILFPKRVIVVDGAIVFGLIVHLLEMVA